ncbi:aspartyl protease [Leptospira semungkisensis]|uniref:Aspartyl protease n=1 Tax=Leptospira semungkisensis TaxID=2484985 RepID=A0A4V3JBA3_9LEPT|nr:retropepsin-like aspartic protease [Leptospira semungkisensis]TGK01039.1 aspartyl protease [Leptospira semungkisensis]
MGKIHQKAEIENTLDLLACKTGELPQEKVRKVALEFLVDTGAAMVCLPTNMIQSLGLQPLYKRLSLTANGTVEAWIFSPAQIRIWDRECNMEIMEVPNGTPPLLGYLALETLDLYPNPKKQILEGNPAHDGRMVIDLLVA